MRPRWLSRGWRRGLSRAAEDDSADADERSEPLPVEMTEDDSEESETAYAEGEDWWERE